MGDNGINELAASLGNLLSLKSLHLVLGQNGITNVGCTQLASVIPILKNLICLEFDLRNNNIKSAGALVLAENIEKIEGNLKKLLINLGGFSLKKNQITSNGGIALIHAIKKFKNL